MSEIKRWVLGVLGAVVRVLLWLVMAVVAVFLLALALVLLVVGVLWALLRGKRPVAPVFVGRFQRFTTERVWPGSARSGGSARASHTEVVDVEVREVDDRTPGDTPPRQEDPPGLEDRRR